ncbi:MAG: acetylornithine deacetylase, partial [Propionibacterium sp.]|nr:acetylornithine deacetylase [Propionibacterium sp.]
MSAPRDETMTWLTRLVGFDTTSRDSNRELIAALGAAAADAGLTPRIVPDPTGQKANLIVSIPDANGSTEGGVMLAGHVD